MLASLMSATWNSFCAVRSIDDPVPGLPKLSWPGLPRARAEGFDRQRGIHDSDALVPDRETYALEVFDRIPARVLVERGIDQHRWPGDQPGVAVRLTSGDRRGADVTVGAWPGLHDDCLLQVAANLLGHRAGDDVDDSTGGGRVPKVGAPGAV